MINLYLVYCIYKFDIMKKLLLLLIGLTVISCGGSDDDDVTTDPLIGTWTKSYNFFGNGTETAVSVEETIIFNSNGTLIYMDVSDEEEDDDYSLNGVWQNNGTDFNLLNQSYLFSFYDTDEEVDEETLLRFELDFNSFIIVDTVVDYDDPDTDDDGVWRRQ